MRNTTVSTVNPIIFLFLLLFSLSIIFAQEPQGSPQQISKEKSTKTKEDKVNTQNVNSPRRDADSNLEKSQPNSPPTVDYLKEAEKFQKQIEANNKNQNNEIQRQIDEIRQESEADSNRLSEIHNQVIQPNEKLNGISEPNLPTVNEPKQNQKSVREVTPEFSNWVWLILLFELLQCAALTVSAFKYKVARKSVLVMSVGLGVTLILYLLIFLKLEIDKFPIGFLIGAFSYAYFIGKIFSYVIVLSLPEKVFAKLSLILGIGIFLMISYALLGADTAFGKIGIAFGLAVILIGGIKALFNKSRTEDLHGSARFANKNEIKEFEKEIEPGAFILSSVDPEGHHGKVSLPRSLSIMHGLILGGSGTGKSRGYFMPNCAEVKDTSIVVTDPKSELWKYTSGFHQKALRFAPTEPDSSQCFNWIPLCTDARMSELCARAIMTAGSTQNTDQFWIDSETAFLSAVFAHTATTIYPTPLTAYRLFTRKKPEELLKILLNSPSYVAREQAIVFEQTDARIKGAIVPAVASRMQFMRDQNIQLFTSAQLEAPEFGKLRQIPTAVYWCLREQDIARLRPLTSLFFTVLLEQIAGEVISDNSNSIPINLMLDEFANIGKIPDFETTISLARGRNVALWLGIQSLSQLNQTYGNHAAQTIISNCATKVALHGLDYQTAEYISKMLGERTVSHQRSNLGFGTGGFTVGTGGVNHRRQLLTPDEVMRLDEDEAIIRTSNKYPMVLYKGYYNEEPNTFPLTQSLTKLLAEGENSEAEEILI